MADNAILNQSDGLGITLATDDIGGVHYQIVKVSFGELDTATPVSGANPLPVIQTGTLTVQPGNTANTTAWLVTGTGGTFPVTDSGGSLTVDGTVTANLAAGTNNIGDVDVLSIAAGDNNIGNVDIVTVPTDPFGANADAASATGSISAKLRFIAATGIPVQAAQSGTWNVGTVTTVTTLTNITNWGNIVDDAAFTPGTTRVLMAGFQADEASTDSVDEGDGGAARMTLDRKVIITNYAHAAAGGATPYYNLDVDETEDEIKATAGKLFWIHVMNLSASVRYIKFYNATAANVTVGTTTPVLSLPVPTMADTNGAGFCLHFGDVGLQFTTAITVAATTGLADNSTGAPGANEVVLNAGFL